jgi:hypothetical protein
VSRHGRLAWLAALALLGCNLTGLAERESPIAVNRCDAETSCGDGSCENDRCVSASTSLSTLLFSVTPTSAIHPLAGQTLFRTVNDVPAVGGAYTLALDGLAEVTGSVLATLPADCDVRFQKLGSDTDYRQAKDDSIPVRLTFSPSERMLGLPVVTSTVLVNLPGDGVPPDTYGFGASEDGVVLPAGKYDVYIEPFAVNELSVTPTSKVCSIPPELIRGVVFRGGVDLQHRLPPPAHLDLKVKWNERDGTLEHWLVDMLEPVTGRVISTRAELTLPTNTDGSLVYSVGIDYQPVLQGEEQVTGDEIVRLSPPPGIVAPSVLFARSALELFARGSGVIDQLSAIPSPISFEGQVTDAAGAPQQASVTLTATQIADVPPGTLTSFTRSAQTQPDGTFRLDILPGNYRVLVVPPLPADPNQLPFASVETTWQIAATPLRQAGRTVTLRPARSLKGAVFTPQGEGARGAVISAEPSPGSVTSDIFARALGSLPLVPRATSAVVEDSVSGAFTIHADPGIGDRPNLFDFFVRPPAAAGFAWLVLPRLSVTSGGGEVRLPELSLPAPVRLDVAVTLAESAPSETLFAGANVRVYALLDAAGVPVMDPALATSAVPIAESSLDAFARGIVLLPPNLNRP